jgi:hypothetical protein
MAHHLLPPGAKREPKSVVAIAGGLSAYAALNVTLVVLVHACETIHFRSVPRSIHICLLEGNLDVERIHNAGFQLFVVERPANSVFMDVYLFALDLSKGRGFFYRTSKS